MSSAKALEQAATSGSNLLAELTAGGGAPGGAYLDSCKAVIMLWSTKFGLGIGGRVAHGFVISKLHTTGKDPLQEPQWSAPLFVRVHVVNAGILLGFSRSKTLLLSMNDGLLKELMQRGSHSLVGVDHTASAFGSSPELKSDVIALASGTSTSLAATSLVSGLMLDFSFAGGNLKVDHAKLAEVYGPDADAEGILTGRIPPLQVMQPLYTQLNALISGARAPAPHLTRVSLERMTATRASGSTEQGYAVPLSMSSSREVNVSREQ